MKGVLAMNTAKNRIIKLIEELPESRAGEVIDFLEFLNQKKDQELYLDAEEENDLWSRIRTEEKVSGKDVNTLFGV